MIDFDKIKLFLPKYLSPEHKDELFSALNDFPENIEKNFYSSKDIDFLCQGDAIGDLIITDLPKTEFINGECIILSNTCDLNKSLNRAYINNVSYSPIIKLNNFITLLKNNQIPETRIESLVYSIKQQAVTSVLYLPKSSQLDESVVFLNRIQSCDPDTDSFTNYKSKRFFTLSNYGIYLFILKLSIHFTRICEGIDRNETIELVSLQPDSSDRYSYN